MSTTPVVVVAALIWREGKLLLCQRSETDVFPGKWEFAGGKAEPGEEPRTALRRELLEELGIRARIGEQVAEIGYQYPGRTPIRLLFFLVTEFEGIPENRIFKQICWELPQDIAEFDWLEADRPLVKRIAAGEFRPPNS